MNQLFNDDVFSTIVEFLDIKSLVRLGNTSKTNYDFVDSYLEYTTDHNLSDIYECLNISCECSWRHFKEPKIDYIKIQFKTHCEECINYSICEECKSFPVNRANIPCLDCIETYGGRKIRYMLCDWEESDCNTKYVCGFDESEYKGEKCFYQCDYCDFIQNEETKVDEEFRTNWMIKQKTYDDENISYCKSKILEQVQRLDIFYNYIYACPTCFSNFDNNNKEGFTKSYIEIF